MINILERQFDALSKNIKERSGSLVKKWGIKYGNI